MIDLGELRRSFIDKYGREPRIFRAPGRVNLIGEHTDYNDGFVMPCALDFATFVAAAPREDRRFRISSQSLPGDFEFDLDNAEVETGAGWARYVEGVASILARQGFAIGGADIMIASDVPIGAGLSSSAALEVATGFALTSLSNIEIDKWTLAKTGQTAEHEYAGVRSGIMDQFASTFGVDGHALFLDCRSLDWSPIPLDGAHFVIANTKTKHELADGEYNKRRADCEEAARLLGKSFLRDADEREVAAAELPDRINRRARHIVTENARVLEAVDALKSGDLAAFGKLMNASHESLRDDYEVSSRELDVMVEILRRQPNVLGARMTGGGFGGCAVALLETAATKEFVETVTRDYRDATGIEPEMYVCNSSRGVFEVGDE